MHFQNIQRKLLKKFCSMFRFGKEIFKNYFLHAEQKLAVTDGRDGLFLLSHHSTHQISKDFTSQGVNSL